MTAIIPSRPKNILTILTAVSRISAVPKPISEAYSKPKEPSPASTATGTNKKTARAKKAKQLAVIFINLFIFLFRVAPIVLIINNKSSVNKLTPKITIVLMLSILPLPLGPFAPTLLLCCPRLGHAPLS